MNSYPEFLDIKQVAEYLRLKPSTIYKWISVSKRNKTETIPYIKLSGRILFRTSDVLYWVVTNNQSDKAS